MIKIIDDCVDCTSMGLHCQGPSCPNRRREVHCCDGCGSEEELYYFEGGEYCSYCIDSMTGEDEDD